MKFFTILLSLTLFYNVKCYETKCYQEIKNPFSFFASKTAYCYVSAKTNYKQPNCKVLQLWMLSRHGTRHPEKFIIENIAKLNDFKNSITEKSSLCKAAIDAIKEWNYTLTKENGDKLNKQGANDLSSLGIRLRDLYKDIFNETYNPKTYKVLSSPKSRSLDSAFYFVNSAFNINVTSIPLIDKDDMKLNLTKYKITTDDDDLVESLYTEIPKFKSGQQIQQLLYRVSQTLGFDYNLTLDTVISMYEACRFEKALYPNSHPAWCAVFSQEDLEVLEYNEDLRHYYVRGYGNPQNEGLGCPIVKDLITNFKEKSQGQQDPKGVFYFGHSSNILSAIVRLGFGKDNTPLLSTNYEEMRNRKWRTSILDPFASNVIVILYECDGAKKVTFFINENPMIVEKFNCILCPWEKIEEMFDPIVSSPACTHTVDQSSSTSLLPKTIIIIGLLFLTCVVNILTSLC